MDIQEVVKLDSGKEYKLYMKDGDLLYRWHGDGKKHPLISGGFTSVLDARLAMKQWQEIREKEANKPSRLEELKECKTNDDIKEFCNKYNLSTPDTTNLNARKKAIKEKLLAQGDKE